MWRSHGPLKGRGTRTSSLQTCQTYRWSFHSQGFTINFGLNKTNVVISFQGKKAAPAMRTQYLHQQRPGVECDLSHGRTTWLHFKPTYKHLGFTYAASQSIDVELRSCIGQAQQAIPTIGKPILFNRHLEVRLPPLSGPGGNQTLLWFGNLAHSHSAPDADLAHSSCEHAEESNAH